MRKISLHFLTNGVYDTDKSMHIAARYTSTFSNFTNSYSMVCTCTLSK